MPAIAGRPTTERTSGTKGTPAMTATAEMQGTALTNAAAVTPETSNSKDDIDRMTATTAGMQTTAEMNATARPPT